MDFIDETHAPELASWVDSAQSPGTAFPIQNLPHGVFRRRASSEPWRGGVAIGDRILDVAAAHALGVFDGEAAVAAAHAGASSLNGLMALGPRAWTALRRALSRLLRAGSPHAARLAGCLVAQDDAEFAVPASIGDYTDFYTSIHHASAVGRQFRPDNPLLPNFRWVPIAYHARSSSIVVSGQPVVRPVGQTMPPGADSPSFGPCKRLDYELELGVWIGPGNVQGEPIAIGDAESHVFGMCLLDDWSARDVQGWEYQPLGPFLAKNFASTVSPWIVTMQALAPFRVPFRRAPGEPAPLAYLDDAANRERGAIDVRVEAWIQSAAMRAAGRAPARLSASSYRHAYWTLAQMVAHHTVGGCNLRPGDLLGTGTQSGPTPQEAGSLTELSQGGRQPVALPGGETRTFLEDGDALILRAYCERDGFARIGFGECAGIVQPASGVPA